VVHRRREIPSSLSALALDQAGVLTRAQATESGLSRHVIERLREQGTWHLLATGVYFTGAGEVPWMAKAWAGVLIGGTESALAGRSAAVLHGLADGQPLPIQVLVPHRRKVADRAWLTFQRQREDLRLPYAPVLPMRTRIEDTVLDLCAAGDPGEVITWITKAVQRRVASPARLLTALRRRRAVRHRGLIEQVLGDAASGVHSQLEYRFGQDVLRSHRLPAGRRQFQVPGTGRLADVAYEEYAVLVELDGRIGHVEEGMWRDRKRDNAHAVVGWLTLRFGWWEVVNSPCAVAADIAAVLRARGWPGLIRACPNCGDVRTA